MMVLVFSDLYMTLNICHNNVAGDGVLKVETATPKHAHYISVADRQISFV